VPNSSHQTSLHCSTLLVSASNRITVNTLATNPQEQRSLEQGMLVSQQQAVLNNALLSGKHIITISIIKMVKIIIIMITRAKIK
jgi:hypothetical protein